MTVRYARPPPHATTPNLVNNALWIDDAQTKKGHDMEAEYRAALARVEAEQRANPAPLTPEQQRLRRLEEHERRQRQQEATACQAGNDGLHREHVTNADAEPEAARQQVEGERLAEAGERLRGPVFRTHPLATEDEFARAVPRLLDAEAEDRIAKERRAMLASPAYARF